MECSPVEPERFSDAEDEDRLDLSLSPLFATNWARIILDEAHRIKSRNTSTCQAALSLTGVKKWCVSGTPLQNRVGELFTLVRFIQLEPYAYLYCSKNTADCKCDCKLLDFKFGLDYLCSKCGHAKSQHRNYFAKHITLPLQKYGNNVGLGKKAMTMLKTDILGKVMLRRTKVERQADLQLPPITISVRRVA